jgi:hypothetical protein
MRRAERSGRVMFPSHCVLSENTRYLGGTFRPGAMREVVTTQLQGGRSFACARTLAGVGRCNLHYRPLNPRRLP